ncbi:hypothetical protein F441_19143 [Phytophthora nicotianae CJ01A1]|uniref:Transposase zinc-ribbon domain-containing protein n=3 Tax=Phytophthora nicotianae TaxID=4792 RepID=W2QZI1_PHYN3|nr:hypothetical protein PPTG_21673 [Phytophthora nicotianae INRA-310]ETK74461.1 hypothetical protein L915_18747 [Phytophthora nicotianae]ETP04010.1 hypothetical protein F441_19143 [Phytophthora nicotianae CJ01A1]ETL27885.1 hypothetical protein L916_18649 [Phytophthora nicotianae]ETL81132.1 hypothetical protein L917_18472 [Phytophthora nicotianae]ETN17675.1 hypothetical protein PPTG_21673 [Phytophthora nicotianae INRA-310]
METPYMYHVEDEGLFVLSKVMEITWDIEIYVLWCMEVGIIDKQKRCPSCGSPMKSSVPRKLWRCSRRDEDHV